MNIKDGLRIGLIWSISLLLILGCQSSPEKTGEEQQQAQDQEGDQVKEGTQDQDKSGQGDQDKEEGQDKSGQGDQAQTPEKDTEKKAEEKLDEYTKEARLREQYLAPYVEHLINTARGKMVEHDFATAKTFLDEALEIDPTNEEALQLRNTVGRMLGEKYAQEVDLQDRYSKEIQVKIEQAKLEAQNHFKNGMDAIQENNYDHAIREFERTVEIITLAPYELGLDSLRLQAAAKIKEVQEARARWQAEERKKKMEEAREIAERLEAEEQARRASHIRLLLAQAVDFYTNKKYDRAEQIVEQVLMLDPANKSALDLREDIREARYNYISQKTLENKIEGWKRFLEDVKEVSIPYSELMKYPEREYWVDVVERREKVSRGLAQIIGEEGKREEDSEAIRDIKKKLDTKKIAIWEFNDTPFQEVITVIRYNEEINIVVDAKVIENFEMQGIKVTLQLSDILLKDALGMLLDIYKLTYVFRNDVLFITDVNSELAQKKVYPQLHDIRDLTGQIKDFPGPIIELATSTGEGMGTGALFTQEEEEVEQVITEERLIELIRTSIAPGSWEDESGLYSIAGISGQLLVVHDEKVQNEIQAFLNDLRSFSGTMVAIESRFLEVTDDFLERVGVDWRGIGDNNLNFNARDQSVLPAVTSGFEDEASTGASDNTAGSFSPSAGLFFQENNVFRNQNGRDQKYKWDGRMRVEHTEIDPLTGERLRPTGGLSMQIATLDDIQLSAVLWLVKKTSRAELLMAPRLTAFNTQRAHISVVQQRAYVRDFDVEVAQSAYIADPVIGTIQTGVVLDVRPIISNDLKYITMELRPTVASETGGPNYFTTELGGRGRQVTFEVPEIRLQSVQTTVRIPDQGTLMLGGLKTFREMDRKLDIPVLGNIPVISFFFSERTKVDEKQNLLILVTGKIVDLEEERKKAYGVGE